jgi:hypothetical protein
MTDTTELEESFQNLKAGDIFHGTYPGMCGGIGSAICLVTDADAKTITARTVTTHMHLVFDRVTMTQLSNGERKSVVTVDSTKRLPVEIYNLMLEIDWKYDPSNPVHDAKLTRAQMDALIYVAQHYGT